ncbi:hypothetical protein AUR64_09100 [Haloprofundus marisrubri]|uniref:Alpha integrin n=1 Tax=Haloprofundus marisrubri TaxID=1514971 RepID=A0A0W1R802_9EURY|nr:FG-GAP repeat protein [Haloprofundus marisrubri]KTG09780.1 hypothetical protein AUR64_09100 [Haloprofundus marisrubri]
MRTSRQRNPASYAVVAVVVVLLAGTVYAGVGPLAASGSQSQTLQPPDATTEPTAAQQTDDPFGGTVEGDRNLSTANTTIVGQNVTDRAGWRVVPAGDVNGDGEGDLLVSAPRADRGNATNGTPNVGPDAGAVYLFYGPVDAERLNVSEANATFVGVEAGDLAGSSVAAGDVDGDGLSDVIVGAPGANGSTGAVYLSYGSESLSGVVSLADANETVTGASTGDAFGYSLAVIGNGSDEFANATNATAVLVGAPFNDSVATRAGAAHSFDTSALAAGAFENATEANATYLGEGRNDRAGWALSPAGDFDNDSRVDALVGARGNNTSDGAPNAGAAYVVTDGLGVDAEDGENGERSLSNATLKLGGVGEGDNAGFAVADAGDVNADGLSDVVVGAPGNDTNGSNAGAAYVVFGAESEDDDDDELEVRSLADANATLYGAGSGDQAGWSVSSAGSGDVNCDAFDDVLVGAPRNGTSGSNTGAAYLVYGGETLAGPQSLTDANATFRGTSPNDRAGFWVSDAGDLDGDDREDILVGAPYADGDDSGPGAAYVIQGRCEVEQPPAPADGDDSDGDGADGNDGGAGDGDQPRDVPSVQSVTAESLDCEQVRFSNPNRFAVNVSYTVVYDTEGIPNAETEYVVLSPGETRLVDDSAIGADSFNQSTIRVTAEREGGNTERVPVNDGQTATLDGIRCGGFPNVNATAVDCGQFVLENPKPYEVNVTYEIIVENSSVAVRNITLAPNETRVINDSELSPPTPNANVVVELTAERVDNGAVVFVNGNEAESVQVTPCPPEIQSVTVVSAACEEYTITNPNNFSVNVSVTPNLDGPPTQFVEVGPNGSVTITNAEPADTRFSAYSDEIDSRVPVNGDETADVTVAECPETETPNGTPNETTTNTTTNTTTETETATETTTETETETETEPTTETETPTETETDTPTETDTETPTETDTETPTETDTETPTETEPETDTETPVDRLASTFGGAPGILPWVVGAAVSVLMLRRRRHR